MNSARGGMMGKLSRIRFASVKPSNQSIALIRVGGLPRPLSLVVTAMLSAAIVVAFCLTTTPAHAATPASQAQALSQLVQSDASRTGNTTAPQAGHLANGKLLASPGGAQQSLSTGNGQARFAATNAEGQSLGVTLPTSSLATSTVTSSGTVVYTSGQQTVAGQFLSDGSTRIATVINSASDPSSFSYTFTLPVGTTIVSDGSGGLEFVQQVASLRALFRSPGSNGFRDPPK